MAGEHVTTQHKPVVFVVRTQKKKQTKTVDRDFVFALWRCKDEVAGEYKEQVTVKYEDLSEKIGGLEEEWKKVQRSICVSCRGAM